MQATIHKLRQTLQLARHRHLVVLQGDWDWRIQQLEQLETQSGIWIGSDSPFAHLTATPIQTLRQQLGQEIDCAVFSAEQGLDADALAIVSGMIRAGGLLWILLPTQLNFINPANQRFLSYPYQSHQAWLGFQSHLISTLEHQAWWLTPTGIRAPKTSQALNNSIKDSANQPSSTESKITQNLILTADQQLGLQAIERVAFGHRNRPLMIEADRGRGKTTLLGLAAAQLLQQGKRIILTAARYAQTEMAFKTAAHYLNTPYQPGLVTSNSGELQFKAPDDIRLNQPDCDILMIDEAAHLPSPLLQDLVQAYPRVIFASTLLGYEGSGRGFSLRFKPYLAQHFLNYKTLHLQQPVRWNQHDPLESLINQALCLDAELSELNHSNTFKPIQISAIQPHLLTTQQLNQVMSLLMNAHYQTSPADLQHLLSAPDLRLYLAQTADQLTEQTIIGVLLVCQEGDLPDLSADRRVKGHLVPQLLRQHSGQLPLLNLKSERVLRIAVHPQMRRQTIATQLINHWQTHTQVDFYSASFGVTPMLHQFWRKLNFRSVHLGAKRDKASGTHNIVMVATHSDLKSSWPMSLKKASQQFQQQLPHSLMETLTQLQPGLVMDLLAENNQENKQEFDSQARNNNVEKQENSAALNAYIQGHRPYESMSQLLWQLTLDQPQKLQDLTHDQQGIWLDKILRKHDWKTVALRHQLAGRKAVEQQLKSIIKHAFNHSKPVNQPD